MAEIGSAFVTIAPSARGFGSKLNSQVGPEVDSAGKGIGSKFGTAFKVGAAAAVGGALIAAKFLKGSIDEAREAQKVGALTNAVIKSTGGVANVTARDVDKLSTALSLKTGVDDEAIAAGQNMLLTFGNVRNEVGKGNDIFRQATVAANDMAAAFGGDAVSNSKILGKALNDPTAGVSALTRVGVSFTQQQKDQIKTLQESGDMLGAQKIVLGELSKQTKGAAESQATAGDKFKTAFANLQESVGTALLPALDSVLGKLSTFVIFLTNDIGPGIAALNGYLAPAIAAVKEFFGSLFAGGGAASGFVATLTATVLPVLQTMANTFTTKVLPAITSLVSYVGAALVPIFVKVASIVTGQLLPVIASLAQFFYGTLYPAVIAIVAAIATQLKPVFDQLVATIRGSILPTVEKLIAKFREYQPTLQKVALAVVKVIGFFAVLAAAVLGKVLPVVIKFAGFLISNLVPAIAAAIGVLIKIAGYIVDVGVQFVDGAKKIGQFAKAVDEKVDAAISFVRAVPGKVKEIFSGAATLLVDAGRQLMSGLAAGIREKISDAVNEVKAGLSKIRDMLPGSPIKNGPLKGWNGGTPGRKLMEMLADGMAIGSKAVQSEMTKVMSRLESDLEKVKGKFGELKSEFDSIAGGVASAFTGNLFEAGNTTDFLASLTGTSGTLSSLTAAFKKLTTLGFNAGFLAQLFQSGNAGLILDLAAVGNESTAKQVNSLFGGIETMSTNLGNKVADNKLGDKMTDVRNEIRELRKDIKQLAPEIGKTLNGAHADGHKKGKRS